MTLHECKWLYILCYLKLLLHASLLTLRFSVYSTVLDELSLRLTAGKYFLEQVLGPVMTMQQMEKALSLSIHLWLTLIRYVMHFRGC